MAQRLCDAGHYAQNTIRIQAAKLEREWKSLAAALDDRSTVLSMSVMFHKKAETVCYINPYFPIIIILMSPLSVLGDSEVTLNLYSIFR